MARGRMLNTTVASDLRLNELSLEAHWAYMMAVPHLDRDGIMLGHPKVVAGKICPLRPEVGVSMPAIIDEWVATGLVIAYDTDNGPALYFAGFQKNQNLGSSYPKEGRSVFPPPPGFIRTQTGLIHESSVELPTNSRVTPDQLPTNSRVSQDFCPQVEVEVKEEVKEKTAAAAEKEASPTAAAAAGDAQRLFQKWDANNLGKRTESINAELDKLLTKYPVAEIEEAINIACKRNKRNLGYIAGILEKGVRSPPIHTNGHSPPSLSEQERGALLTRASNAKASLRTAEKFGGAIDPQWQKDIDRAKEVGVL